MSLSLAAFPIEFIHNHAMYKAMVEQVMHTKEIEVLQVIGGTKAFKIKTNRPFKITRPLSVRQLKFQVLNPDKKQEELAIKIVEAIKKHFTNLNT